MNPNEVAPIYEPDVSGETSGYLKLRFAGQGEAEIQFVQPDKSRVFDYSRTGRLLGIEFIEPGKVDLTELPQDEIVPQDGELVEIFSSYGITPQVSSAPEQ